MPLNCLTNPEPGTAATPDAGSPLRKHMPQFAAASKRLLETELVDGEEDTAGIAAVGLLDLYGERNENPVGEAAAGAGALAAVAPVGATAVS